MIRSALITAILALSLIASVSASPRADRQNALWRLRCRIAYVIIHADGHTTDAELAWLGSFDCWEDGTPVGIFGP